MDTSGYLTDIEFAEEPELLDMSGQEFAFIRRKLKVPQSRAIEKGEKGSEIYMSHSSIWELERQEKMNPAAVREFLLGKPTGLIIVLRRQFKELKKIA